MKALIKIPLLICTLFLTGCAANIKEVIKDPIEHQELTSQKLFLDISASKYVAKSSDLNRSISELDQLIKKNYSGGISTLNSNAKSGLSVKVLIKHYRHVSGFGRFMAGVMVGDAELSLTVQILDLSTDQILGESILDTRSEFSEGVFGATTSRQLEAMSQKIINIINSSTVNS